MSALVPIGESIWLTEGAVVDFHGSPYPTRSVIVRLRDGELWIWSPIALSASVRDEVLAIGQPRHLVSPNKLHHLYLGDWHRAFPEARIWGSASTVRKRSDLSFQAPLGEAPPAAWVDQIDQCWVRGSFAMDEIVFFHRPSRTVILADLSENFSCDWLSRHWSRWQRPLARVSKIVEGWGYAPLDWRMTFLRGRKLRAARTTMLGWDPLKVVMAHGEWQREGGREYLVRAFAWME